MVSRRNDSHVTYLIYDRFSFTSNDMDQSSLINIYVELQYDIEARRVGNAFAISRIPSAIPDRDNHLTKFKTQIRSSFPSLGIGFIMTLACRRFF